MERRVDANFFGHGALRLAVVALPVAAFLGALALTAASPFAWGAGNRMDLPSWFPPATGLAAGLPSLALTGIAVRRVWKRTAYTFHFNLVFLSGGIVALVPATFMLAAMSGAIGSPETYEAPIAVDGAGEPSPGFLVMIGLFGVAMVLTCCAVGTTVYARAFEGRLKRYEEEDRPDTVGMMMRRRRIEDSFTRPGTRS